MTSQDVVRGDCVELLRRLPGACIDAIVTDPPYELGFMGKKWDAAGIAYSVDLWREALRVLKPGGHLLAFGGTRTYHRMTCAIEDAGFEVRDCIQWIYGTGFPASLNFDGGRGTALKPSHEPIVMGRRRPEGTTLKNVETHGTGALNIDAARVEGDRWPANVILDEAAAAELGDPARFFYVAKASTSEREAGLEHLPKKSAGELTEREDDTDGLKSPRAGAGRGGGRANAHPTVKPISLMRHLIRLVLPPGGIVLDPFGGSGTTGCAAALEGANAILFEREEEYVEIAESRIEHWRRKAAESNANRLPGI